MKNTLIALVFIAIGATSIQAQTSNRYDWGIEGGPNLSNLRTNYIYYFAEKKAAIFGSAGFIFQYNTKKILSFKTGFSYQRKGSQTTNLLYTDQTGNSLGVGKNTLSLDYITLPILVKASFGKKVQFFVNAGPYVGFLIAKTDKTTVDTGTGTEVFKNYSMGGLSHFDFGITSGVGISIPIKESWKIHAELRNYFGLTDINTNAQDEMRTNTTDFRVGLVYRLGFRE
jgi:hypothetical protein